MKSSAIQNNKLPAALEYIFIALACCLGFLLAVIPLTQSLFVLLVVAIALLGFFHPLASLTVLLVLSPARTLIATESEFVLPLDIGQILWFGFIGFWFVDCVRRRRPLVARIKSPTLWMLLLFIIITGLSGFVAGNIAAWMTEWLKWVIMGLLAVYVLNNPHHKLWIAFALVLAGFSQAIVGLYTFLGGSGADHLRISGRFFRAFGTFGQPNPFGGFMGLIAPLAIALFVAFLWAYYQRRSRLAFVMTVFYGGASAVMTAALVASWSRGAWLGFTMACVVMLAALPRRLWQNVLIFAAVGAVGLIALRLDVLPVTITDRMQNAVQELVVIADVRGVYITPQNYAVIERLAHWQAAINMAQANPLLGVGFGNYDYAYEQYRLLNWEMSLDHAHNYYLNVMAETGTIGLLVYLLLFSVILFNTWQARQHPDTTSRLLAVGLLGSWVYLLTHSLTDNLYVNNVFIHIGIMIGLMAALFGDVRGTVKDRQDGTINN